MRAQDAPRSITLMALAETHMLAFLAADSSPRNRQRQHKLSEVLAEAKEWSVLSISHVEVVKAAQARLLITRSMGRDATLILP